MNLLDAVMDVHPELCERVRFTRDPTAAGGRCRGVFSHCDPETGEWRRRHSVAIEELLSRAFKDVVLSEADRRYVYSRRGREDMVRQLATRVC